MNEDRLDEWKPSNTVKEPPKAFYDWIDKKDSGGGQARGTAVLDTG
jgi:hypothetical protein